MLRVLLRGGPRGQTPASAATSTSEEGGGCIMDAATTTTTTPSGQVKPKLAEALPLGVVNMMNVAVMKATSTIATTKGDRKEELDFFGHEEEEEEEDDDRVEGKDGDEDVDMDSPRYKKPRREVEHMKEKEKEKETKKQREHEIDEHMDTHSEEEREEPLDSLLFSTFPPELVVRVFHYLPVRDLARASQTCSLWYSLAQEDQIWRSLFHWARHQHFLECSPSERAATSTTTAAAGGEVRRRGSVSTGDGSWKARFRDTYSVKRKFWFGSNEAFVHLDHTSFRCSEDEDEDQFLTGEVVLNIYSESITTHGLYLALAGEECFKAIDAESLSMNATEEKSTLVEVYVPLSGNTEWSERKKNKHMFFRGTYHYPFRVPIPRKTIADLYLPPSFNRRVKTSSGFFRVTYHAYSVLVLSFPHSNMTSRKHPLRFRLSDRMENRLRTKVMRKYSAPITDRLTHNSFNYIFFQKSGNVVFEVELQKQYFFINAEEMKIGVSVDNSQGRFPVHSITVALVEVLQERGNGFCREVVERRGSRRVYGEADGVQVAKGEVRRDIELYYPVSDANAKGGSLFNCALFQQRFAVCVSLNIFGCVDPRLEIPLFVLRVPS